MVFQSNAYVGKGQRFLLLTSDDFIGFAQKGDGFDLKTVLLSVFLSGHLVECAGDLGGKYARKVAFFLAAPGYGLGLGDTRFGLWHGHNGATEQGNKQGDGNLQ